jgi:hypothetical protein
MKRTYEIKTRVSGEKEEKKTVDWKKKELSFNPVPGVSYDSVKRQELDGCLVGVC